MSTWATPKDLNSNEEFRQGKCKYCQESVVWQNAHGKYLSLNPEYTYPSHPPRLHNCKVETPKYKMGELVTYTNKANETKMFRILGVIMNREYAVEQVTEIVNGQYVAQKAWNFSIKLMDEKAVPANAQNYDILFGKVDNTKDTWQRKEVSIPF